MNTASAVAAHRRGDTTELPALRPSRHARYARRLGLRARLTATFAIGALLLSTLLSAIAYGLVRENLVRQRERSATSQAYLNARNLRDQLRPAEADPAAVLDSLTFPGGGSPVLFRDGWFVSDVTAGRDQLPQSLREAVLAGTPARMRYDLEGEARLAIGVPLPSIDAAYFEIVQLAELEDTLGQLGYSLLAAGLLTTLAGALVGARISRRVLQPLADVRQAAAAIAGGRLDTRVAVVDDADLGALVTSFNDMARALQERIERDARFASDVSHELRSPLTTLTASIQVLESRRDDLPERSRAALDLLVADANRFGAMVEDLLEISRFDAGAAHLELDEVRISELVCNAVGLSTEADVEVDIESGAADCWVHVDKRRMVRVVANLLGNADRYAGGATRVTVGRAGETVRIAVEDAGPGIPDEDRERVFERFARGAGSAGRRGSGEGVGLGLALVREHINLHGGRVWTEGFENGASGARFVVELPILAEDTEPEPEEDLGPAAVPAAEVDEVEVG
jgi:two-component system sensor histidine kinase MtrB